MRMGSVPGPPGDLNDAPRFVAGTSPFLGIFMASVARVSRVWAYQPEVFSQNVTSGHAAGAETVAETVAEDGMITPIAPNPASAP